MWKATCKCNPNQFVAYTFPNSEDAGILVEKDGEVTNRYEDGTVGVDQVLRDLAQESADNEGVYCPICGAEAEWEGHEFLRNWRTGLFCLALYDTYKKDGYGKSILEYVLTYDNSLVFRGFDFHCSPLSAADSDEAAAAILELLASISPENAGEYPPAQIDFVLEHGEEMTNWAYELENPE